MKKNNSNRFRCTVTGCNPKLYGENAAEDHKNETGHRTAKWPVRSAEGERRARQRNKSGYYDKYNVGDKSAVARGLSSGSYLGMIDTRLSNPIQNEGTPIYVGGEYCGWEDPQDTDGMYDDFEDPGF